MPDRGAGHANASPSKLAAKAAARLIGVNCPTFTDVDQMLDATRPRLFMEQALPTARWKEVREELKASAEQPSPTP